MRWFRRLSGGRRPRVITAQRDAVRIEEDDHLRSSGPNARTAIIAHWSPDGRADRSTSALTNAVLANGYEVVVVSTAQSTQPLEWAGGRPAGITVLRRPNIGYDFGSWATALEHCPRIAVSTHVLMLNDSLVGPFQPIDDLLEHFHQSPADVWGMTDTTQFRHHLQSYCLGFKSRRLLEAPLARFWRSIRVETSREGVIWRNEIGLSRLLERERFVVDAAIPYWRVVADSQNPTIVGWQRLLDEGFPFVKRQLVREPYLAPDGLQVRAEIQRRFGVNVDDWL